MFRSYEVPMTRKEDGTFATILDDLSYKLCHFSIAGADCDSQSTMISARSILEWAYGVDNEAFKTKPEFQEERIAIYTGIRRAVEFYKAQDGKGFIDVLYTPFPDERTLSVMFYDNAKFLTKESNPFWLLFNYHPEMVAPATVGTTLQRGSMLRVLFPNGFNLNHDDFQHITESAIDIAHEVSYDITEDQVMGVTADFVNKFIRHGLDPFVKNLTCQLPKSDKRTAVKKRARNIIKPFHTIPNIEVSDSEEDEPVFVKQEQNALIDDEDEEDEEEEESVFVKSEPCSSNAELSDYTERRILPGPRPDTHMVNAPCLVNVDGKLVQPHLGERPFKMVVLEHVEGDRSTVHMQYVLYWFTGGNNQAVKRGMAFLEMYGGEEYRLTPGAHPFTYELLQALAPPVKAGDTKPPTNPYLEHFRLFMEHPDINGDLCAVFSPGEVMLPGELLDGIEKNMRKVTTKTVAGMKLEQLEGTIAQFNKFIKLQTDLAIKRICDAVPDSEAKKQVLERIKRQQI